METTTDSGDSGDPGDSGAGVRRQDLTVLDCFCGVGLSRMALELAGWRIVWANDSSLRKLATYSANFPDASATIVTSDIHVIDADSVPHAMLAAASFPCTDLSLAGLGAGIAGAQSGAVMGFLRLIRDLGERRPALILLENVPGWLSRRKGAHLLTVTRALANLDYALDLLEVDAARFLPQSRPRVFLIAVQAPATPLPEMIQRDTRPRSVARFIAAHPDLPWRLSDPEPLPCACEQHLADLLDADPDWWDEDRVKSLVAQMSATQRERLDAVIERGAITIGAGFRRTRPTGVRIEMRWDGLAGCLRTAGGGSSRQFIVEAGRGRLRARYLTPMEGARLMGAGRFIVPISTTSAFNGLGDAVCVPAVEWIATHVLMPLCPVRRDAG